MKKIVLICDSFKGCLTSIEVEQALAKGILAVYPDCQLDCIPIADGGEGMLEVMMNLSEGILVPMEVHDALMRPIQANFGLLDNGQTAVIEMAQASGLPLLQEKERNPLITTSYGTGELIKEALIKGCKKILIGIGGSATNDGGMGMLQALGVRFYDASGHLLSYGCGKLLGEVASIDTHELDALIKDVAVTVACDVDNPLCGPKGATAVFAPQKGASSEAIDFMERGMKKYAHQVKLTTDMDITNLPGAGAAGGLGGALAAFFHGQLLPGIELILETVRFCERIREADLIITGEGKADAQTLHGKVPSGVLHVAQKVGKPVVLIAGGIDNAEILNHAGFTAVLSITPGIISIQEAMKPEVAKTNLSRTATQIARLIALYEKK